jgi:hypothetical protein
MLIWWGTKKTSRKQGFVADYCVVCRNIGTFKLSRVGMASHVYGASIGQGDLLGHTAECSACKTTIEVNIERYSNVSKKILDINDLVDHTNPGITALCADRFEVDRTLSTNMRLVPDDVRKGIIFEVLHALNMEVHQRFSATHLDKEVYWSILGLLTYAFLALPYGLSKSDNIAIVAMCGLVLAIGFVVYVAFGGNERFMRRSVFPKIASALSKVNPTEKELKEVLFVLDRKGYRIGAAVKLEKLMRFISGCESPINPRSSQQTIK